MSHSIPGACWLDVVLERLTGKSQDGLLQGPAEPHHHQNKKCSIHPNVPPKPVTAWADPLGLEETPAFPNPVFPMAHQPARANPSPAQQ